MHSTRSSPRCAPAHSHSIPPPLPSAAAIIYRFSSPSALPCLHHGLKKGQTSPIPIDDYTAYTISLDVYFCKQVVALFSIFLVKFFSGFPPFIHRFFHNCIIFPRFLCFSSHYRIFRNFLTLFAHWRPYPTQNHPHWQGAHKQNGT